MTDTAWLADRLPQGCFVNDEGEIRMRASGRQFGYEIHGLSLEAASPDEITAACERLRASMSHLSTNDMVHVVFHRLFATDYPRRVFPSPAARMIDDERRQQFSKGNYLRTVAHLFITNQDEKPLHGKLKAAFFGSTAARSQPTEEIERERLYQRLKSFEDSSPLKPRRLDRAETFRSLILSITGIDYPAIPPSIGAPLHEIIAQQDFVGGNEPSIGELHIRPVSITAYPAETVPQMLAVLLRHEGQLTVSVRFICQDPQDTQEQLQLERTFWVRAQQGSITDMIAKFLNMPRRKTLNQDIEAQIADIDEAIAAAAAGLPFGWCTATAIVRDTDSGRAYMRARQLVKDLNAIGMNGRVEDANASAAWFSSIPGNGWDNIRRPMINAGNFAEMVMPVEHWQGTEHIDSRFFPKGTPVPFLSVGTSRSPFYLPSHIRGVAHQLVIGPTTGGKSTLLGALVAATTGIPDVRIVWLDRDYSSFVLAHALGANYRELAADGSSPLCPLEYLDHENGVAWLFDWFVRLFARWDIQLDEVQVADLTEALETAKSERLRTMTLLMHLVQDQRMRGVLVNYTTGGKWGHIFDGTPAEHTEPTRLTVIEMRQLDELGPRAAAPATELIVHGVEVGLGKSPTFVFADEAWKLLTDPVSKEWLYTGLRTFRKYNAGFIFATQSLTEVANSDYRDLLLESCAGKIFLPNSEVKGAYVREAYLKLGLTEREIDIIGSAIPQREYYFHSSIGKRKFTLDLGPIALALCAATGIPEVAQAREMLEQYGPDGFLEAWLHARGLGPAPTLSIPTQKLIVSQSNYANGKVAHQ